MNFDLKQIDLKQSALRAIAFLALVAWGFCVVDMGHMASVFVRIALEHPADNKLAFVVVFFRTPATIAGMLIAAATLWFRRDTFRAASPTFANTTAGALGAVVIGFALPYLFFPFDLIPAIIAATTLVIHVLTFLGLHIQTWLTSPEPPTEHR